MLLGVFALYHLNKPKPERKTEIVMEGRGVEGIEECLPAFEQWLKEHLPPEVIPKHIIVEVSPEKYMKPVGTLNIFYSQISYPRDKRVQVWTACEKKDLSMVCKVTIINGEKLTEGEKGALITIGLADCIFEFLTPRERGEIKGWSWEMFQPLIRKDGSIWVSNCLRP
ncbi:MAG: hypothetical protein QW687_00485 [Candidatus Hadarchaeales archaeon]